jgi:sugar phosphate permease
MRGKWTVLAFLCVLFVVYTIDRALLGLLAIPIQKETGMSNVRFGMLNSAIFWTYALVAPFAGLAGDRFNRARLVGLAAITWSLMAFLAGFAGGFWALLLLASFAVVVPQTLYSPTASAFIASIHKETRTIAMSCHQAAFYTGWFVSGAAVAGIVALFGTWRAAFFSFGALGMFVGVVFLFLAGRNAGTADAVSSTAKPALGDAMRAFWGCRSALLAGTGYVAVVFVSCGYCAWGPKFISDKFSISASEAGTGVMFWHYAASFASILVAGFVTDRLVGRYPRCRLVLAVSAFMLAIPFLLLFAFGTTLSASFAGAALLGSMLGVLGANQFTNLFDVIPSAYRSGAIGFLNIVAGLVGSLSPMMLGALSQRYGQHGFELGFAFAAAVMVVPIVSFLISYFVTFNKDKVVE